MEKQNHLSDNLKAYQHARGQSLAEFSTELGIAKSTVQSILSDENTTAIYLAAQEPECLLLVTKRLYPEVARRYNTNWRCVERNIRTVCELAWRGNRAILEEMAWRLLPRRPSATEFLAILVADMNFHVTDQV